MSHQKPWLSRPQGRQGGFDTPARGGVALLVAVALLGGCRAVLGIEELSEGEEAIGVAGESGASGPLAPGGGSGSGNGGKGGSGSAAGAGGTAGRPPGGGGSSGQGGNGAGGQGGGECGATDEFEPNDEASKAKKLDDINTCDFNPSLEAVMEGGDDWFAFKGSKSAWGGFLCGEVDARASVLSVSPLRVCYYLKPASHVSCPQGTEFGDDPVPGNYAGCCASNATSVTFASNNADVLIKVSSPSANACFPYTLQYNY